MKKDLLIYGLCIGVLLIVLQALQYKYLIQEIDALSFSFVIAALFLGLGLWIARGQREGKTLLGFKKDKQKLPSLSDREWEVLQLLCEGMSNKEMAQKLFLSENTIKTHLSNLYLKLNVERRTQAVQVALSLGLMHGDDKSKLTQKG